MHLLIKLYKILGIFVRKTNHIGGKAFNENKQLYVMQTLRHNTHRIGTECYIKSISIDKSYLRLNLLNKIK